MASDVNPHSAHLQSFVVDVLRYDIESLDSILKMLNNSECIGWRRFWPHPFTEDEAIAALKGLVQGGQVQVLRHDRDADELVETGPISDFQSQARSLWFRLTVRGREAWERWEPPHDELEASR